LREGLKEFRLKRCYETCRLPHTPRWTVKLRQELQNIVPTLQKPQVSTPPTTEALLPELDSCDHVIRDMALTTLVDNVPHLVDDLIRLLGSDATWHHTAARTLYVLDDPTVVDRLVKVIREDLSANRRRRAAHALGWFPGKEALAAMQSPEVLDVLHEEAKEVYKAKMEKRALEASLHPPQCLKLEETPVSLPPLRSSGQGQP
jgi:hypothetical protein